MRSQRVVVASKSLIIVWTFLSNHNRDCISIVYNDIGTPLHAGVISERNEHHLYLLLVIN